MKQSDQHPSVSSTLANILDFLEKIPGIRRVIAIIRAAISLLRNKSDTDSLEKIDSGTGLPPWFYRIAFISGMAAALVSFLIECQVMVDVYNSEGFLKFLKDLPSSIRDGVKSIWGSSDEQAAGPTDTQQNTPTHSFWFPLLTVAAFEGAKFILVLYRHIFQRNMGFLRHLFSLSGATRFCMIVISCYCSVVFFAQLMNKPNEDEINREIEKARTEIFTGIDTKIDTKMEDKKDQDEIRKGLLTEVGTLQTENKVNREDLRKEKAGEGAGGGPGDGHVAKAIVRTITRVENRLGTLNGQIADRERTLRAEIREEVIEDANKELEERTKVIRKDGRALDPKWMSAVLSALYEGIHSDSEGSYTRRWAIIFLGLFSLMVSIALELIINEMFRRFAEMMFASHNDNVSI